MTGYDTLYQLWLKAKQDKDYTLADQIRARFEYLHGETIIAEGKCVISGVTVQHMKRGAWLKRHGNYVS